MFNFVFERVHLNTVKKRAICTKRGYVRIPGYVPVPAYKESGTATINKFDL
jgi:hypothetical protein